jgi:hypothetical protein
VGGGGPTSACRGSDWDAPGCWRDLAPLRTSWHLWRSPCSSSRAASCSFLLASSSLRAGQSPSRMQALKAILHLNSRLTAAAGAWLLMGPPAHIPKLKVGVAFASVDRAIAAT